MPRMFDEDADLEIVLRNWDEDALVDALERDHDWFDGANALNPLQL